MTITTIEDLAAKALELLAAFVDTVNECQFDHNGDCQMHGFTGMEPGEICPNEQAKRLLRYRELV